jgi:hypothetical protein
LCARLDAGDLVADVVPRRSVFVANEPVDGKCMDNWTYLLFPHDQVVALLDRAACLRPACSSASRNNANGIVAFRLSLAD